MARTLRYGKHRYSPTRRVLTETEPAEVVRAAEVVDGMPEESVQPLSVEPAGDVPDRLDPPQQPDEVKADDLPVPPESDNVDLPLDESELASLQQSVQDPAEQEQPAAPQQQQQQTHVPYESDFEVFDRVKAEAKYQPKTDGFRII